VERFRRNPAQAEIIGVRNSVDGPAYYLARPSRVVSQACLACHTRPDQAPPAMVQMYGTAGGYGWKYDEIVGAQIVSVPLSLPIRNAYRAFFIFMASMIAVFAALLFILNLMTGAILLPRPRR
jgi:protein-histidine pros-kinase